MPPDIRILAYADVPPQFDSRFSCIYREYKYFFFAGPDEGIDVEKVRKAAKRYVGLHDFRNFCKRDEPNDKADNFLRDEIACRDVEDEAQNYKRRIYQYRIVQVSPEEPNQSRAVYMAVIKGSAFLQYQVRSMMAILFMVGRGIENETIIDELLDVEKIPEKPNYRKAEGENLILSDCGFEGVQWKNCNFFADYETFTSIKSQLNNLIIEKSLL